MEKIPSPTVKAEEFCKNLQPQNKPVYVRDSHVKGLVLRILPSGSKYWIYCYSVRCVEKKWKERRKGLGPFKEAKNDVSGLSVTVARREAESMKNDVRSKGADPIEEKLERTTKRAREEADKLFVKDLFEKWAITDLINRKDNGAEAQRMMKKDVLPYIGNLNILDVGIRDITEITDRLLQRGVKRMAKVVFSLIRQMFRFGVTRGYRETDPTATIGKKTIGGANVERDRVLSEDEIRELAQKLTIARLAETTTLAIWIILATCSRIGELLKARWSHIDFERKTWRIPPENSKNEREHIIFLSQFALQHFLKLHSITGSGEWCYPASRVDGHVCPKTVTKQIVDRQRNAPGKKNRTKHIGELVVSRGIWKPHDLRRTGATLMTALGVLPEVAERCLNHLEQNRLKATYLRHGYEAEKKQAWEKLGQRLGFLMEHADGQVV